PGAGRHHDWRRHDHRDDPAGVAGDPALRDRCAAGRGGLRPPAGIRYLMTKLLSVVVVLSTAARVAQAPARRPAFQVEEATIAGIQQALMQKQVTTVGLVEQYLWRIQAYNGT